MAENPNYYLPGSKDRGLLTVANVVFSKNDLTEERESTHDGIHVFTKRLVKRAKVPRTLYQSIHTGGVEGWYAGDQRKPLLCVERGPYALAVEFQEERERASLVSFDYLHERVRGEKAHFRVEDVASLPVNWGYAHREPESARIRLHDYELQSASTFTLSARYLDTYYLVEDRHGTHDATGFDNVYYRDELSPEESRHYVDGLFQLEIGAAHVTRTPVYHHHLSQQQINHLWPDGVPKRSGEAPKRDLPPGEYEFLSIEHALIALRFVAHTDGAGYRVFVLYKWITARAAAMMREIVNADLKQTVCHKQ